VAVYENPTQNLYYNDLMEQVARSLPDIQFYFFGDETKKGRKEKNIEHLGWIDLKEWMPKFSCNLRVTIHDGLPLTPLQFLTAGRYVISTTPLRGAAEVKPDRKEIVEAIRTAQSSKTPEVGISEYWHKELDFNKFKTTLEDLCKLRK
jgi:hypothetical protein